MKKKITAIILTAAVIVGMLAGCGNMEANQKMEVDSIETDAAEAETENEAAQETQVSEEASVEAEGSAKEDGTEDSASSKEDPYYTDTIFFGEPQGNGATPEKFKDCMDEHGYMIISEDEEADYTEIISMYFSDLIAIDYLGFEEGYCDGITTDFLVYSVESEDSIVTHSGKNDNGVWAEGWYDEDGDRYFLYVAIVGDTYILCSGLKGAEDKGAAIVRALGY